jgi:hypothetical protein
MKLDCAKSEDPVGQKNGQDNYYDWKKVNADALILHFFPLAGTSAFGYYLL